MTEGLSLLANAYSELILILDQAQWMDEWMNGW